MRDSRRHRRQLREFGRHVEHSRRTLRMTLIGIGAFGGWWVGMLITLVGGRNAPAMIMCQVGGLCLGLLLAILGVVFYRPAVPKIPKGHTSENDVQNLLAALDDVDLDSGNA